MDYDLLERGGDACVPPEREVSRVFSWGGIPGGGARGGPPPVSGVGVLLLLLVSPQKYTKSIPKHLRNRVHVEKIRNVKSLHSLLDSIQLGCP